MFERTHMEKQPKPNSYGEITKTKLVDLDGIYDFIVDDLFI